jgi:hypothetical protein
VTLPGAIALRRNSDVAIGQVKYTQVKWLLGDLECRAETRSYLPFQLSVESTSTAFKDYHCVWLHAPLHR